MFPRAPLPERIGAYSVLRRLPSAGGADRYLGREEGPRGFTRMVELKLAPAEADPEVSAELAHEASVVSKLNHPYISRMFHFFEHEGRLVLVLERLEGTTLGRILASMRRRRQKLPDEAVFHVAHRLVSAIAHAHGMVDEDGQRTPVVHRSISPASLLVGWGGEVRLSGFGLAKIMGRSPDTAVGLVKGTPGYMAPEQLRGERITERTDVFQAGLVIWEMLSGNPPAAANAPQKTRQAELVMMMSGPELAPAATLRPSLPREVSAVIDAMLEVSVEKRKISAAEVERWLAKTVDVERGREALRERAIALRGQETRDSNQGADPMRTTQAGRRTTTTRRDPSDPVPSMRRTTTRGEASGHFSMRSGAESSGQFAAIPPMATAPGLPSASPPATSLTPASPQVSSVPPARVSEGSDRTRTAPATPSALAAPSAPPAPAVPASPAARGHALADNRVTQPEDLSQIPVEGERGASTLITQAGNKKAPLVVVGVVGAAALLVGAAVVVSLMKPGDKPAPTAAPSASQPPPPASTEAPPPDPVPTAPPAPAMPNLGPKQGALLVKSSAPGLVYVNGAMAGETDKILVVTCGPRFVRVGSTSTVAGRTVWLTAGISVKVSCGVLTEVDTSKK